MSKTNKVIRWGIVGSGDVTEVKSGPAYQKTEGFELKAVMRRNLDKVKDYAKRHNVEKYYTNADELINDSEIDAVYIATPPDTHKLYGLKVAEAGKICCIEKPLAPNYADCLEITNAFKEKNIPLFSAYYRRSLPRFLQVNNWLKANKIGEVRHINWHLSQPPSAKDLSGEENWRTDPSVAPGGYFDDLASHGIDLFNFLLGDIVEVNGFSLNQQRLYGAKDAFVACWVHKGGITGTGTWNFGSYSREEKVSIYGSKGKIDFSLFHDEPIFLHSENDNQELMIENPKHIQLNHVQNMQKQLLENGDLHPSTGESATHAAWVMDQILGKEV